jgi:hypothetical protein
MATSEEFQDIAEQRAILESIRLYESDRQLSDAIKRSMGMENQSKKVVAPKQADPDPASELSDSDDDAKDMFANEIKFSSDEDADDVESDDEIKLELPKKKQAQAPADGIKEIKAKLRAEIIAELKAEEAKKHTKKPTKK